VAEHGHGGDGGLVLVVVLLGLLAVGSYLAALRRSRRRRPWARHRVACWVGGIALLGVGSAGPLAAAAHRSFVAHAVAHVLVGMAAPLLLVGAAPVTVALRALPVQAARLLSRVLRSRPARLVSEPAVAAALNLGGLWLLYLTPLYAYAQAQPAVHLAVHLHLVAAGCLLTAALVSPDPIPHRRRFGHRAVVLVAAVAGHAILAKYLYAHPPDGVTAAAAETGAMVMYYAGDAVEVVLMVVLCRRWFALPSPAAAVGPG